MKSGQVLPQGGDLAEEHVPVTCCDVDDLLERGYPRAEAVRGHVLGVEPNLVGVDPRPAVLTAGARNARDAEDVTG